MIIRQDAKPAGGTEGAGGSFQGVSRRTVIIVLAVLVTVLVALEMGLDRADCLGTSRLLGVR